MAKCPKVVAGLISKVEMIFGALRTLLELSMQPCARHGNFYTPRTPERTYGVNQSIAYYSFGGRLLHITDFGVPHCRLHLVAAEI